MHIPFLKCYFLLCYRISKETRLNSHIPISRIKSTLLHQGCNNWCNNVQQHCKCGDFDLLAQCLHSTGKNLYAELLSVSQWGLTSGQTTFVLHPYMCLAFFWIYSMMRLAVTDSTRRTWLFATESRLSGNTCESFCVTFICHRSILC